MDDECGVRSLDVLCPRCEVVYPSVPDSRESTPPAGAGEQEYFLINTFNILEHPCMCDTVLATKGKNEGVAGTIWDLQELMSLG